MANVDNPFGFLPVADEGGGGFYTRMYIHAAADTVALGIGDLVDITGAADTVAQAVAGGPFLGVSRAHTLASVLQSNHPVVKLNQTMVLVGKEDSVGGAIAAASEGLNCDIIVTTTASTTTGLSGMEIDSSTAATTSTLDSRLLGLYASPDNAQGVDARWLIKINDLREADLKAGL